MMTTVGCTVFWFFEKRDGSIRNTLIGRKKRMMMTLRSVQSEWNRFSRHGFAYDNGKTSETRALHDAASSCWMTTEPVTNSTGDNHGKLIFFKFVSPRGFSNRQRRLKQFVRQNVAATVLAIKFVPTYRKHRAIASRTFICVCRNGFL